MRTSRSSNNFSFSFRALLIRVLVCQWGIRNSCGDGALEWIGFIRKTQCQVNECSILVCIPRSHIFSPTDAKFHPLYRPQAAHLFYFVFIFQAEPAPSTFQIPPLLPHQRVRRRHTRRRILRRLHHERTPSKSIRPPLVGARPSTRSRRARGFIRNIPIIWVPCAEVRRIESATGKGDRGELVQVRWNDDWSAIRGLEVNVVEEWYDAIKFWNECLTSPDSEYWVHLQPGTAIGVLIIFLKSFISSFFLSFTYHTHSST